MLIVALSSYSLVRKQFITTSRPTPPLPWDVLLMIVKQVDHQTLVVLSAVSIELLVAAVPILYRDVEIRSVRGLWSLFGERHEETDVVSSKYLSSLPYRVRDSDTALFETL